MSTSLNTQTRCSRSMTSSVNIIPAAGWHQKYMLSTISNAVQHLWHLYHLTNTLGLHSNHDWSLVPHDKLLDTLKCHPHRMCAQSQEVLKAAQAKETAEEKEEKLKEYGLCHITVRFPLVNPFLIKWSCRMPLQLWCTLMYMMHCHGINSTSMVVYIVTISGLNYKKSFSDFYLIATDTLF